MKKKFFTLLAAAAFLVGTAVPALASVPHTPFTGAMVGGNAKGMVAGANKGLYHITNVDPSGAPIGVLYVDNSNTATAGLVAIDDPTSAINTKSLMESLWCVEITTEAQGKNPSFSFLNKAYGDNLRAENTAVTNLTLDGPLVDWKFSNIYGASVALEAVQPLYSYINGSQAIVLVEGATPGSVATAIADVTVIETAANALTPGIATITPTGAGTANMLFFTLSEAAPIVLNAQQFNTKLGVEPTATGQKLTFDPDKNVGSNPFSENVLKATDITGGTAGTADWYLNLQNSANKYLRVDTAKVNATGSYFLTFKFTDTIEDGTVPVGQAHPVNLKDQYAFRFVYFPSHDSLIINVKSALQPSKSLESLTTPITKFWEIAALSPIVHGDNEGPLVSYDDVYLHTSLIDFTYVILQDLNNNKVVTIGELPSQTRISLGIGDCTAASNKTSLDGLYTIRNAEGKYLQIPIYTDTAKIYSGGTTSGVNVPQWVTLEKNVDPTQMPSFQWVVEKVRTNDPDNTSQIKITSREFGPLGGLAQTTVQLWKDKTTPLWGANLAKDAAGFTEMAAIIRTDSTLGYKAISEELAKLTTYTFNYLNDLDPNDTHFLSVKNSDSDSLLYVQTEADAFALVPARAYIPGTGWSNADPVGYGYSGNLNTTKAAGYIKDLKRTAYVMKVKEGTKIKNTNKIVVVDKEGRYAVTSGDEGKNYIASGDSAVFYFKTNNTKNGRNFYALVDTASMTNDASHWPYVTNREKVITIKAGVADHNLWVKAQNHYEVRTSAFAIDPNEEPLYRRFNRTVDGVENGSDSFYSADNDMDAPVKLRFFRSNNSNEFLYEDAHSVYSAGLGIDFLGVKHQTEFGLSADDLVKRTTLYVDTAFVNRPATPNLDFDTPKPQYLLGVGIKIYSDGTIDQGECEPEIVVEGYTRGRYLVNATDSVYGVNANWSSRAVVSTTTGAVVTNIANDDYIWNTKWERLAFVDAIHKGDILYILNGQKYNDPIQDFTALDNDPKVEKVKLNNNLHKDEVFSFRLIESEKDVPYVSQAQKFMIESETEYRGTDPMIAPMNGGWVKIQNGVPVISRGFYEQAITDAEIFQVVSSDVDPAATPNEDINVTAVSVVAGNGNVTILNAAGKTVTISNILGQTVANTTISSDNVTIAAPKGIVVVAVQGEDAVKAIVK